MKLLKNKRGMAMESAILFMLIVFMFGLLLTGVAMTSHLRVNVNNTLLSRELEIEQIGEDFIHFIPKDENDTFTVDDKYEPIISPDGSTLTLKRNGNVVLYIDKTNNIWKYTAPQEVE